MIPRSKIRKIRQLVVLCLVAAFATAGLAQDPVLVVSTSGYYLLTQDASGKPVMQPVSQVVVLGQKPNDPHDPNDPNDPVPSKLTDKVRSLTEQQADPTTARALAKAYELVRDAVSDGSIEHAKSFVAVSRATDLVLREQRNAAKWKPWRDAVSVELAALQQEGKLSTKADYVRVLGEIHDGLMAATAQAGVLDNIDWERLLKLIELIIRLISTFSATEGG